MHSRELTLREVLAAEMGAIRESHEDVVAAAIEGVPLRAGFVEFVEAVQGRGDRLILLSAGFRQLIEPLLESIGVTGLELISNSITFNSVDGAHITWRPLPVCDLCDQECKRGDVAAFRDQYDDVTYIGDGFSDRCAAETADRIFARAGLATYLDGLHHPYESFETFHTITDALATSP